VCGIVACRGREHAPDFLVDTLRRREYRGDDPGADEPRELVTSVTEL
jgi:hypothetical protein